MMDFGFLKIYSITLLKVVFVLQLIHIAEGQGPACTGQTLGEANPHYENATAGPNTGSSYILLGTSMAIPCCGTVAKWKFASKNSGTFTGQVWRKTTGSTYKVLGETATVAAADTVYEVAVAAENQTSVEQNDYLGWVSSADDIVAVKMTASAMGRVTAAGKTDKDSTATWSSSSLVNNEQWMIGAVLGPNTAPDFGSSLPHTESYTTPPAIGDIVHTLTPDDVNKDDIAGLTVSIDPPNTDFILDGNDVKVQAALTTGTYTIGFKVVDNCEDIGTGTLTVTITNQKPIITSLPFAAAKLKEDTQIETTLHILTVTDDDGPEDLKCSMSFTDPATGPIHMKIASGTSDNVIVFIKDDAQPLKKSVQALYKVGVKCFDGLAYSDVEAFHISIEENEDPVPTIPTEIDVPADASPDDKLVFTATASDTDGIQKKFTMDCISNCPAPFIMLETGEMYPTKNLNDHRDSPYVVGIYVDDGYSVVGPTPMTIKISNINHVPKITYPTEIFPNVGTESVAEHTIEGNPNAIGADVVVFKAEGSDEDAGDVLEWHMTFDNDYFQYDKTDGTVRTKTDLNYEWLRSNNRLTTRVKIRTFDGREYSNTTEVDITVTDANETPEFKQKKYSIETVEGKATLTLTCPLFDVTDVDISDTRTYDIDCGAVGSFHIPSTRTPTCDAFIQQIKEYDLDIPGAAREVVTCIITCTDKGDLSTTTTLEILVKAEDDNTPYFQKTKYSYSIPNDTLANTLIGQAIAEDLDWYAPHKRLTYESNLSSDFVITSNGEIRSAKDWTTTPAPTTRTFYVTVKDDAGHESQAEVFVSIYDVPEVTTTTTTTTPLPDIYSDIKSFWDDPGNIAWAIIAMLLGLAALGLLGYMLYRCCTTPNACASMARLCRGGQCCNRRPGRVRGHMMGKRPPPPPRRPPATVPRNNPPPPPRQTPSKPHPPREQPPPKKSDSSWNCFKRKPSPPPPKDDGNKIWHMWNHGDFNLPNKDVG